MKRSGKIRACFSAPQEYEGKSYITDSYSMYRFNNGLPGIEGRSNWFDDPDRFFRNIDNAKELPLPRKSIIDIGLSALKRSKFPRGSKKYALYITDSGAISLAALAEAIKIMKPTSMKLYNNYFYLFNEDNSVTGLIMNMHFEGDYKPGYIYITDLHSTVDVVEVEEVKKDDSGTPIVSQVDSPQEVNTTAVSSDHQSDKPIESDMIGAFMETYKKSYEYLYNRGIDIWETHQEYFDVFDEWIEDPAMHDFIIKCVNYRADGFTSDREIGAFVMACYELGIYEQLHESPPADTQSDSTSAYVDVSQEIPPCTSVSVYTNVYAPIQTYTSLYKPIKLTTTIPFGQLIEHSGLSTISSITTPFIQLDNISNYHTSLKFHCNFIEISLQRFRRPPPLFDFISNGC